LAFKVQVGPPQIAIHQGRTVLVTEPDGQITGANEKGLYYFDTRVISNWAIYANGRAWELLNGGAVSYYEARIFLTNGAILTGEGAIPPRTLGLTISRSITGGMHEDLEITNNNRKPVRFQLEVAFRSDFADVFEVRSGHIVRRGQVTTDWSERRQRFRTAYSNQDFHRAVTTHVLRAPGKTVSANGRLSMEVALQPGETWQACLLYELEGGEQRHRASRHCVSTHTPPHSQAIATWLKTVAKIRTSNEEFYRLFHQALEDMAALRLPIEGTSHTVFIPAAGLPWFVAPFGRDSLLVSLQNILVYPEFARGALEILGALQAKEDDPWRDAEPGKIPHERRYGELAHFKLIPHTPYYGTADATPLYLITLHSAWRATGEQALLERHLQTAEGCLAWIDRYGDLDGDGFQEYRTRSTNGLENMGWKDSGDAVVYPDGSLVKGPKALCELQGYVYDAWVRMAEVYDALGNPRRARELRAKASALFAQFNEVFWDEELGFYAYALDGDKKKVLTIASNPGHCLWSGIVPPDRARKVMERLMAPDMWSGWGIRTLSAGNPAFNPYNYQTGAVWPHDNAIIAMGFKRYGFDAEAARIAHDVSVAASHFQLNQLPELYTASQRTLSNFPVQYIGANVPQAWAAGAVFMLTQALLGFMPDAPNGRLYVDPDLPAWLPDLTMRDLHIGRHKLDLRFWREDGGTAFEVTKGDARIVERCDLAAKMAAMREGCGFNEWTETRPWPRRTRHAAAKNGKKNAGVRRRPSAKARGREPVG
jgi:glycogen debranching enzyme